MLCAVVAVVLDFLLRSPHTASLCDTHTHPPLLPFPPVSAAGNIQPGASERKRSEDEVQASALLADEWGVHAKLEPELYDAICRSAGVAEVQAKAIKALDNLIAWLREQADNVLEQAEAGADPLIKLRTEVDTLLEAVASIESEVLKIEAERTRIEAETLQVVGMKEELDAFKDLTVRHVEELNEELGTSLRPDVANRDTRLPFSEAHVDEVMHRRRSTASVSVLVCGA